MSVKELHSFTEGDALHGFLLDESATFAKRENRFAIRVFHPTAKPRGENRLDSFCRCCGKLCEAVYAPTRSRYRNVTIWARVQLSFGAKCVLSMPVVISFSTAHSTA